MSDYTILQLIRQDKLDLFEYALKTYISKYSKSDLMLEAAVYNSYNIFKYLHDIGTQFDIDYWYHYNECISTNIFQFIVNNYDLNGHDFHKFAFDYSSLKWFKLVCDKIGHPEKSSYCVIQVVHKIDFVKYLVENDYPLSQYVLQSSITKNCLDTIKYLMEMNCPYDSKYIWKFCENNMANVNDDVFEYLINNIEIPVNNKLHKSIAKSCIFNRYKLLCTKIGHPDIKFYKYVKYTLRDPLFVKYLIDNNYELTKKVFMCSVIWGNIDTLKYLKEAFCPYDLNDIWEEYFRHECNDDLFDWMLDNIPYNKDIMKKHANIDHWLHLKYKGIFVKSATKRTNNINTCVISKTCDLFAPMYITIALPAT
jgi:hypothetical protein